jgi:hypothetical protein
MGGLIMLLPRRLLLVLAPVAGLGLLLLRATPAAAQLVPSTAEITVVRGAVEVRLGGPTAPWTPARPGMRLAELDEIRALAGASAELVLPDRSTLVLSENSRFVVSRLRVGPGNQARSSIFHLTVGKLRAIVTQAALQLVQLRQSTFAISTPAAVASVRGTDLAVTYTNPMSMACRNGSCCCIATATGVGIVVGDGYTSTSGDGVICSIPRLMTPAQVFFFYGTTNPAGVFHPMMSQPATLIDPVQVERWGCDPPATLLNENPTPTRFSERLEFLSPHNLLQLAPQQGR